MSILNADFFARSTLTVARQLLGQRLVHDRAGSRLSGVIVETEAYVGPDDSANHARRGRTPRTEVMFGPPGQSYVYLIYGMYHMLNIVTEGQDFPAAVLIRALEPQEGISEMQRRRGQERLVRLTSGPGKLCQALGIDRALNRWDVTRGERLWLEAAPPVPDEAVATGPRIGIGYAQPQDQAAPWRFWLRASKFVSR